MHWVLRNTAQLPAEHVQEWAEQLEISEVLAALLWSRGLQTPNAMQHFMNPSLRFLSGLAGWPGLQEAGEFLADALLAGQKVAVWGDYDVDGITGTALVLEFLQEHGFSAAHYIPNRLEEGYGLNTGGIEHLHAQGVQVLLTVDSGISDVEPIALARQLGMDVIVTDHHLPGEELPPATHILNPRLHENHPCPTLAGVGVAFFLMAAVNAALHARGRAKVDVRPLLDLVALGTLADVVDLHGQNRILVKNGLLFIGSGKRVGIAALKSACNLAPSAWLGAGQVVFSLAPRLNAAGRLGSGESALELLLTQDRGRAGELAQELSRLNAERREEEDRILLAAKAQAEQQVAQGRSAIVVYHPTWHPGIIGIVASRLVESLNRPSVVLCEMGSCIKGSARSVPGFDVHEAFGLCAKFLLGFGGHKMAAGVSMLPEQLKSFHEQFNSIVASTHGAAKPPLCKLDGELSFLQACDFDFLKELEMLQPFGMGNAEPVFYSQNVLLRAVKPRRNFLQLELEDEGCGIVLQAKAWRLAQVIPASMKGKRIHVAYTPRIDRYNGAATVELRLKDWREAGTPLVIAAE